MKLNSFGASVLFSLVFLVFGMLVSLWMFRSLAREKGELLLSFVVGEVEASYLVIERVEMLVREGLEYALHGEEVSYINRVHGVSNEGLLGNDSLSYFGWEGFPFVDTVGVVLKRGESTEYFLVNPEWLRTLRRMIGIGALFRRVAELKPVEYIVLEVNGDVLVAGGNVELFESGRGKNRGLFVTESILPMGRGMLHLGVRVGREIYLFWVGLVFIVLAWHIWVVLWRKERLRVRGEDVASLAHLVPGFAHRLKNPLNALMIALQRIERGVCSKELIILMKQELVRMERVIDSLIEVGKPLELVMEYMDLSELVEEVVQRWSPLLQEVGITLELRKERAMVRGDRARIEEVIENLLSNAKEAIGERGGRVCVEVRAREGGAVLRVLDDGPGIPDEIKNRIFEPYFTTKDGGMGIGLTVIKRIVRDLGGRVRVVGGLKGGAGFEIFLPG